MLEIETILNKLNVPYRLIRMSKVAFTVEDVVKYALDPVDGNQTCKTIVLWGQKSNNTAAILLKGNSKLDFSKVRGVLKEPMNMATAEQVKTIAGTEPGAVCPFMINTKLYIDEDVLDLGKMNCGSGDHLYGLEVDLYKLIEITKPEIIDVSKK